ncbi:MAG: DUF2804 domain-containing protein [Candidatus Izemoplasmatales bacterium]|nr:DUF2804 domain-containing protein [Candidatus Izemoplasmatales bacterium]
MQHEIINNHNLLDDSGKLIEAGYSRETKLRFNKENIKVSKFKLKTWDYYLVGNKEYAISLTLAHNGYMAVCGIQIFDFLNKKKYDYSKFIFRDKDKIIMPNKSFEDRISYQDEQIELSFNYFNDKVEIIGKTKAFQTLDNLKINITLSKKNRDHMSIAIPFKKKHAFYFNEKFNHLLAEGYFVMKDKKVSLDNNYGVLDWGRGVWPYDNTWYWSSASGMTKDNILLGFNLGYGFGDTSKATENIVYYDGFGYKFEDIVFYIPEDFESQWKISDNSKNINLVFNPIYDNKTKINYILLGQDAHQVFGVFNGEIVIEGRIITVNNLFGFAEKVRNRW